MGGTSWGDLGPVRGKTLKCTWENRAGGFRWLHPFVRALLGDCWEMLEPSCPDLQPATASGSPASSWVQPPPAGNRA